jgi:hypothetical protein
MPGRERGFQWADIDTGLLRDEKLRRIRRELPQISDRVTLAYIALILESWAEGKRLTVEEAAPEWLDVSSALVDALRTVKLVDRSGRIPAATWREWYERAAAARERLRCAAQVAGRASAQARVERSLNNRSTIANHPVRADRSKRLEESKAGRAATRQPSQPTSIRELLPPPPGYKIDSSKGSTRARKRR